MAEDFDLSSVSSSAKAIILTQNDGIPGCCQRIGLMTDKPFSNGREYVDSGFVHDLTDTVRRTIITTLQHVWPFMNTDFPDNVLVVLSVKNGAVVHASCDP